MPSDDDGENRVRPLRICCGPRCVAEPGHRAIYRAIEKATHCTVEPTLCRARCGEGVTFVLPDGEKRKARSAQDATIEIKNFEDNRTKPIMPTVKVLIPTPLRKFTGEADTVMVDAENIGALLKALNALYPGLGKPLIDENGNPRKFVNIYVGGEDIRFLENAATPLKEGDEVSIVPAIAGGASGTEVYQITFNRGMFHNPVLYAIGKKFRVVVTIRRANLSEEGGWAEIALTGPAEEIGRAIAELHTTGANVTGPVAELIEPDDAYMPASVGRGT